jgi:hypothetical protein
VAWGRFERKRANFLDINLHDLVADPPASTACQSWIFTSHQKPWCTACPQTAQVRPLV